MLKYLYLEICQGVLHRCRDSEESCHLRPEAWRFLTRLGGPLKRVFVMFPSDILRYVSSVVLKVGSMILI